MFEIAFLKAASELENAIFLGSLWSFTGLSPSIISLTV